VVVSLAKGIELGTGLRMSEVIAEAAALHSDRVAVVTGPNLAREIAERQPSASVVASTSLATAEAVQGICHTPRFRAYTNTDVVGCELGGAAKNVIALAVGIAVGIGLGANATASVITRGLAEITRLGTALGADPYTLSGLAGLGDLVATCSSPLSRNRTFGEELGKGRTVAEITASTRQVAEGVKSCASIQELAARCGVELPIVEAVAAVIAGVLTPREMITALMSRSAKPERY
jgi:glycerol-3-phosphate dehydrogenase (NAD(P)+)